LNPTFEVAADCLGIIRKVVEFGILPIVRRIDAAEDCAVESRNFVDIVVKSVDFVLNG
jgi:hypothetical protein